jgi:hypothetical protein
MAFLAWLSSSAVGEWVSGSTWAYPGLLFVHTLGLGVLVGLNSAVGLRLLGFAPRIPVAAMEPLFPLMWAGFWLNAASGSVLFIADAPKKAANPSFLVKLVLIALAVVVMRALRRHSFPALAAADLSNPSQSPHAADVTSRAKMLAVVSLVLWAGAITAGRLMAYTAALR